MTEQIFIKELKKLNININEKQLEQLNIYANFLIEYNKHTNLTAIKNIEDIYLKHFYDSLTLVKNINLNNYNNLLDIGTGAGFPGIVLKIIYPNLDITLLDSNNKKIKFLYELSNKLNIKVELVNERAEEYIKNNRETFDIVTTRAVAYLPTLLELTIPYLKVNGIFIALKGRKEDLSNKILNELNTTLIKIEEFNLPYENSERNIYYFEKISKTNPKYPRQYSKIIKSPL